MKSKCFVQQKDSMQCGIAALTMICRYYGCLYSLDFVSNYCHPTNEGVSLLGISDAAKEIGFETVAARVTIDELAKYPIPVILHWNQNHFVVLYKISKNLKKFYIADPGKGKYSLSRDEFHSHWISIPVYQKGVALFITPTENFGKLKEQKVDKKTLNL